MTVLRVLITVLLLPTGFVRAGAANPGPDLVMSTPAGAQMRYADNHGKYTYTFFSDGRYRFVAVSQNETMADSREGRWEYQVTGPSRAELRLDGDSVISLKFDGVLEASGTIDDDVRTYRFSFTRPDGE